MRKGTVMQTMYQTMNDAELAAAIDDLEARVAEVKARELKLDMARGKPSPEQVAISRPMLDLLSARSRGARRRGQGARAQARYGSRQAVARAGGHLSPHARPAQR